MQSKVPFSLEKKQFLTLFLFILFIIILVITSGYFVYSFLPKISTYIYKDQNKSPVVQNLLRDSSKNLTQKEYGHFLKSVSQIAVPSDTITIKNCTLTPKITKADKSTVITLRNLGSEATYLSFGNQAQARIEASSLTTLSLSFLSHTPIVLGIGCMDAIGASGLLYIP